MSRFAGSFRISAMLILAAAMASGAFSAICCAISMVVFSLLAKLYHLTGGTDGVRVAMPTLFGFSPDRAVFEGILLYVALGLAVMVGYLVHCYLRSPMGKALEAAVTAARGEILVFSDANSQYDRAAIRALVRPFADPAIGGRESAIVGVSYSLKNFTGRVAVGVERRRYPRRDRTDRRGRRQPRPRGAACWERDYRGARRRATVATVSGTRVAAG
jgi:hypothetical protein